jgi:hypothetical protein
VKNGKCVIRDCQHEKVMSFWSGGPGLCDKHKGIYGVYDIKAQLPSHTSAPEE